MINSELNKQSYNLVAKNYASEHGKSLVWKDELDKFIKYLNNPKLIIDLGCGHGDETIYLAENLDSTKVIGIDFASEMISLANSKNSKAEFRVDDILTFNPEDDVNGIWARASLHHLSDGELLQIFENIKSYSAPGAILCMINKVGVNDEIEVKEKYGQILKRYFNYFSEEKVEKICDDFRLKVIEQYEKIDSEHKFLVSFLRLD